MWESRSSEFRRMIVQSVRDSLRMTRGISSMDADALALANHVSLLLMDSAYMWSFAILRKLAHVTESSERDKDLDLIDRLGLAYMSSMDEASKTGDINAVSAPFTAIVFPFGGQSDGSAHTPDSLLAVGRQMIFDATCSHFAKVRRYSVTDTGVTRYKVSDVIRCPIGLQLSDSEYSEGVEMLPPDELISSELWPERLHQFADFLMDLRSAHDYAYVQDRAGTKQFPFRNAMKDVAVKYELNPYLSTIIPF